MSRICIPLAIQIVIDDAGWWSGEDSSGVGGPYRTGINRHHVPGDYSAIVELGKRLNMRPQAAMILCEWDKDNILSNLPTSTWMGRNWDNTRWVGKWQEEAADIIVNNSVHFELTLHGIGHEYWDELGMTRSEWYSRDGKMRPRDQVLLHLEYYNMLLQRNNLGGFPESFVPTAFIYRFSPYADELASILETYGVKYISTPFSTVFKDYEPEGRYFGTEHGILTVDRSWSEIKWCDFDPELTGEITGPVCGLHWPNVLHSDPARNLETVERWVKFLEKQDRRFDSMLARNTAEAFSQIVYNWGVELAVNENYINLDFTKLSKINTKGLLDYFYIKAVRDLVLQTESTDISVNEIKGNLTSTCSEYRVWKVQRMCEKSFGRLRLSEG